MSEKLTVKNVVNINKSTLSAKDNWSTLKYLDTGNITENQIDTLQIFQKGEKLPSRAKRKVEKGTIIYSTVRPNQKHFGYFDTHSNDLVVSTGFATLDVIDPRINSKYLYYLLTQNSVISQLQSIGENSTSSYPSIRPEDIGNLSFVFPDIDIQNKIADILTFIDKKIQINNQINQELEAMAKTLYDYWFVQFDFPDQNAKPYKSSGGKMVYNPELKREIPEGWGVDSLWNIANFYNGLAMQKYRPDTNEDDYLPVIKIREMMNGFSKDTERARLDIPSEAVVDRGDILFSWSATLEVIIWGKEKGALNQHIFKVTSDTYPKSFIYFELKSYLKVFKAIAELRKTTMGHITQDHLKQAKIVVPPIELISKLDAKLQPIMLKQQILENQNQELTQLRDWLLPMLMNGQVKVE
ncbi:restriction endonuclease subunit S [Streptococcus thermophilus]|uniref:restriction endonuclease subunit S n=1 Tax=Streptococcus thermophilus TaxID=1308 RepID=UPI0021823C2A|nr:restriction endonuclease subunit S [Streptococcus thermophilus]MCS9982172.1 restriction endonuclease subunit S [Streptococcus thermophilus]MCS9986882.1 restriction endonuclease subunit S [Streptococcus thermophilus]MCS9995188.1 restriction endonuclease subunit S [Streptococcus thermophilus]MCT0262086.1 restriction endonuclease subunit S [Streptococcus thermophilus]MCT1167125.1 restriction endonuclease subunit S [Streptococcus thermophilus]